MSKIRVSFLLFFFLVPLKIIAAEIGPVVARVGASEVNSAISHANKVFEAHKSLDRYLESVQISGGITFVPNIGKDQGTIIQPRTSGQKALSLVFAFVPIPYVENGHVQTAIKFVAEGFEPFESRKIVKSLSKARRMHNTLLQKIVDLSAVVEKEQRKHFRNHLKPAYQNLKAVCSKVADSYARTNAERVAFVALRNQCAQVITVYTARYPAVK